MFHAKFGDETHKKFKGKDWVKGILDVSFKDIIKDSEIKRRNTGNRVDLDDRYLSRILSFFVICFRRNTYGAKKWIKKSYDMFVEESMEDKGYFKDLEKIKDKEKRKKIWQEALKTGIEVLKKQDIKNRKEMIQHIEKIE